jgi:hypothetical protein
MSNFYREYKPFRNYLQQFDLRESLADIWRYSLLVMEKRPLPRDFVVGIPFGFDIQKVLYPWELDILAREIVLNAGTRGARSLRRWNDLATVVNHLRRLDGEAFLVGRDGKPDVMFELHRIAHRQFPFNFNIGVNPIMRAVKVLGAETVNAIAERELGLSARQFFKLGMAVGGHFQTKLVLSTTQDYSCIGVPLDASRAFFDRISCKLNDLRAEMDCRASYDENWQYVWNPLEATPVVRFESQRPDLVICPIPRYLLQRTFGGLFYDLVKSDDFHNLYGDSFQRYVGEVLAKTCGASGITITGEQRYTIHGKTFHGVDWIASDKTGHLFIEAKTKRLTVNARTMSDAKALERDLKVLAEAVVQHYRNIQDALDGRTNWMNDGLPVFPVVLTFEDWYIFSPSIKEMLDKQILTQFDSSDLDRGMLTRMPYLIASAYEFEIAVQLMATVGLAPVLANDAPERQAWSLLPKMQEKFAGELRNVNYQLFGDDFLAIVPEIRN